jgi:GntR family transcriptional regulator, carbon starvation induced regulator
MGKAVGAIACSEAVPRAHVTLERFDEPSISAYALKLIRADILTARLKPNSKLRLKVLASRYGVGFNPLREALAILAGTGLVISESQRGFWVAPASLEDFYDVAQNRKLVETTALKWSIQRGRDGWRRDIARARASFADVVEKAGDQNPINEEWEQLHRCYHMALVADCGSNIMLEACQRMHDHYDRYRRMTIPSKAFMADVGGDHDKIAEASLAGDIAFATALLERHIDDTSNLVVDRFRTVAH